MSTDLYVLAIDMGSSSVKASIVSSRGELAGSGLRRIDTHLFPNGGAEQNSEQWWAACVGAAQAAIQMAAIPPERVIAVACTTQWAVTVPVDRGGRAISNALHWMDTRGGPYSRAVVGGWPRVGGYGGSKLIRWIRMTGGAPALSGVDGFGHVQYLRCERPQVYDSAYKFLEPMDYLNARLTGRIAASYSTIFPYWVTDNRNPLRVEYRPELLRAAGIEREKLPDLLPVDSVLGELTAQAAAQLGLARGTKVMMGTGDSHSATIGAGCVTDYEGYFCIGTSAWLSCHVPSKKTDVVHAIYTMPAALPGRYIVGAEQGAAGRCLDYLNNNILSPKNHRDESRDVYGELNAEAATVAPGCNGLIFTPWIHGVLAPSEDPHTRSAFFNQSARTTRAHYIRAVMEGVAFNLHWLKGHVEAFVGRRFDRLTFIGGAACSDVWGQILADILGCPVRQAANPRSANAIGAALAAFRTLGHIDIGAIPGLVRTTRTFDPNTQNARVYAEQFREFLEFYKKTRPIYRRLNAPSSVGGQRFGIGSQQCKVESSEPGDR